VLGAAKFLSLIAIVAALSCSIFLARVALGVGAPSLDRAALPSGDSDDDGLDDGDAPDVAVPSRTALTADLSPPRRLSVEPQRAPATSPFDPRIFRPPISALA
jgi:hypothetical protein